MFRYAAPEASLGEPTVNTHSTVTQENSISDTSCYGLPERIQK